MEKVQACPPAAQQEAITSLEAIEEDFVADTTFAHDLERARKEMHAGRGTPQEELFERFGL